jgi:hypothetical protein
VGDKIYRLQLPTSKLLHDVFHFSQLKQHLGNKDIPNPSQPLVTAEEKKIKRAPLAIPNVA